MRITSTDNATIKQLAKLHQAKRRRQRGEYLLYGETLCEEAIDAGVVTCLLFSRENSWLDHSFHSKLLVSDKVMRFLTEQANVEICAVCGITEQSFLPESHVIVLDDLQDPGNLGTILRTARAFGFRNVFLSENCADPYSIKVLRAAHGAHFSLSLNSGNLEHYLAKSTRRLVTTYVDEISSLHKEEGIFYDIVFGNEGRGIRESLRSLPRQNVRLEIDFESLNVAVAAGIILYTGFRQ